MTNGEKHIEKLLNWYKEAVTEDGVCYLTADDKNTLAYALKCCKHYEDIKKDIDSWMLREEPGSSEKPNKSEISTSSEKLSSELEKNSQKLEKGTDYTWEDVSSVIDAMEYRTNSLIENIKSEILHFVNAHCSGDDINIYDAFKVIDDCCEAENSTTKNDLALIRTWGLDEEIRCTMCTNSMKSDRGCDGSCVVNNDMYKAVMDAIEKRIQPTTKNDLSSSTRKNSQKLENVSPVIDWNNCHTSEQLDSISTTKNDLAVDCVARQDVERYIEGFINEYTSEEELEFINLELDGLKHLPSVTPQESRKGHWISHREHCEMNNLLPSGLGSYFWCSECDCGIDSKDFTRVNYNYCPNCGADMREVEE